MWLAHALTLSRIPIAIGFWWAYGSTVLAVALIAVAALTDTLDGNVARSMKRRGSTGPDIGGWLDPLVDKLFVVIVLGVIWFHSRDTLVIALIGARELLMIPLVAVYLAKQRLAKRKSAGELHADPLGKAATVAQFVALAIAVSVPSWALVAASITAAIGIVAAVHYVVREVGRGASTRVGGSSGSTVGS